MWDKIDFKKKEAKIAYCIIAITSIVTFLSDGLAKYNLHEGNGFYRYSLIARGILQLVFIVHLFFFINKKRLFLILTIIILLLFFFVGQFFLSDKLSNIDFGSNFIFVNRFLYPLIIGGVFLSIKDRLDLILRLWNIIRSVLLVNSVLIVIGLVLDVKFLKTYPDSLWKFGFDGLVIAQNEASYFYIIGLLMAYYDVVFLNKRKLFFVFVLLVSVFIGTKAIYLFLMFLFAFHFFYFFSWKKLGVLFLVVFVVGKFYVNDKLYEQLASLWVIFLRHYEQDGLITALLSGRNNFIASKMLPLFSEYWSLPNFLFGGHDIVQFYMEMGFFDLLLMFGGIGFLVYLLTYSYFVMPFIRMDKYWMFSVIVLFIIVFTSGHFFESPVSALYIAFFSVYLKQMNIKKSNLVS